ncbi:xylulokinase [Microbacterium enclense]|uniref:xylulokinase n=1 Tax=Microbacterium enclense TaxID=993073 RepID=UPI00197C9A37|nr:FGGY-family carbohydrate kinase [Microbacterium enclense]
MSDIVLGVDCSTTGAKCVAWDRHGRAVAQGRSDMPLSIPQPGWGEQDPEDWWRATVRAVRACVRTVGPDRVRALSITHQRESFALMDAEDRPVRPAMLWLDSRAGDQVDRVGTERIHELTGKPPNPTPALYKLHWLSENEPESLALTAHVADVHAYLVHRMTGEWVTSIASADPLGILDLAAGDYSDEILGGLGLDRSVLPRLVEPGTPLRGLRAEEAAELGLTTDVLVVAGSGDGQSAGLGAAVCGEGDAYLNIGTGLVSGCFGARFHPHTSYRAMSGAIPRTVSNEMFVGAGTFMVTWFLHEIAAGEPAGVVREDWWEQQARTVPAGAEGLFVVPYWNGQLTPTWDHRARGTMVGFGGVHTRAHIYRAILEGIAFELRWCLERAEEHFPAPVTEFVAMGGGARSDLWCQIFADVLQRPVVLAGHDEATALGVGILAAVGAGLFPGIPEAVAAMTRRGRRYDPDPGAAARYDDLFDAYGAIYPALRPVFPRIAEVAHV